jgi:hypothetical protein
MGEGDGKNNGEQNLPEPSLNFIDTVAEIIIDQVIGGG